jgi:hypothetical protein
VSEFATNPTGPSLVTLPLDQLKPSVRAKPLGLPLRFDCSRITRLQVLHSKFGDAGGLNPGFRPGPLRLEIRSIHAVP